MSEKILLTINEACERFSMGRTQLYEHIKHGRLNKVQPKYVRRTLLRFTELEALFGSAPPDQEALGTNEVAREDAASVEGSNSKCPTCGASRSQRGR